MKLFNVFVMLILFVMFILHTSFIRAQDLKTIDFDSKGAKEAVQKYLRWEKKAGDAFEKEKQKARKELAEDLADSFEIEKGRGNLDEALKIRETLEGLENLNPPSISNSNSQLIGKWELQFSQGDKHLLQIRQQGTNLQYALIHGRDLSKTDQGTVVIKDGYFFLQFDGGNGLSRCHLHGDRLYVEFWPVKLNKDISRYPQQFAIGVKSE